MLVCCPACLFTLGRGEKGVNPNPLNILFCTITSTIDGTIGIFGMASLHASAPSVSPLRGNIISVMACELRVFDLRSSKRGEKVDLRQRAELRREGDVLSEKGQLKSTMTTKVIIQDMSSILRRSFTAISSLSRQFSSSFSTRTMSSFGRLIRFRDAAGNSRFGEPKISSVSEFDEAVAKGTLEATVFEGSSPFNVTPTSEAVKVQEVLPLLTVEDVPIVKCVGLNYIKHSKVTRDISEIMLLT